MLSVNIAYHATNAPSCCRPTARELTCLESVSVYLQSSIYDWRVNVPPIMPLSQPTGLKGRNISKPVSAHGQLWRAQPAEEATHAAHEAQPLGSHLSHTSEHPAVGICNVLTRLSTG